MEDILKSIPNLEKKPAVALETTVLTHGMPYPDNVKCALDCEEQIRKEGAIPYTIGIINGQIKIGLSKQEIEYLGKSMDAVKVSRRDLSYVISHKLNGSTTVSATMVLAKMANIKMFATGGIGGVHRGFNDTMDVSADLNEFSKTNVNVVCAGPKAILDVPRTLEYLETQGIAVIGYNCEYAPLFYSSTSKYKLTQSVKNSQELAKILKTNDQLKLNQGSLILNPVPSQYSLDPDYVEEKIQLALKDLKKDNVIGKDVTPYLLSKMLELTNGESLKTNVALILNNAKVAGSIAYQLSLLDY